MRSIRLLAATTVILLGAAACGGDDDGGVGPNTNPVASFTGGPCTVGAACTFTDTSIDPDGSITTRVWNFGDGSAVVTNPGLTPSHTFGAAGTYNVMLTVTDNNGATHSVTNAVVVNEGTPTNVPPTAAFTVPACTVNIPCLFTDASTDAAPGTVTAWSWAFGDGGTAADQNPSHTFATEGTFDVTLTVTDNEGATGTVTQSVTVGGPATSQCTASGATTVDCALDITARSTVTVTLADVSCELGGNRLTWGTTAPYSRTVFFNVCSQPIGASLTLHDAGVPVVFEAGTQVVLRFTRGTPDADDPPASAPAANMEGVHPSWSIAIDDGGNSGGAGEPDFADVILAVEATAAP